MYYSDRSAIKRSVPAAGERTIKPGKHMQSEQVKMRFGRCPYCRAMVYQDPKAVVYLCGKCRTPIRGKEPEPTDENEYALAQLEILSFDTMSVFSDELEPPSSDFDPTSRETVAASASSSSQFRPYGVIRTGPRSGDLDRDEESGSGRRNGGSPMHSRVGELRPASRRTRRPSSADLDEPRPAEESEFDVPRTRSASCYQRRASPLSSQELEAAMDPAAAAAGLAGSPLTDPSFQKDLLQALENLRKLIVAVEEPFRASAGAPRLGSASASAPGHRQTASCNDSAAQKVTRRDSRILRRLESQLAQALPTNSPRQSQDATTSSSSSSSSVSALSSSRRGVSISASASALPSSRRGASTSRNLLCRPILGGTPFVACEKCSELLQLPSALSVKKSAMLQCGGCGEELAVKLPARGGAGSSASTDGPRKIFSAPQPAGFGADDAAAQEYMRASARSRLSGEQMRQGPDEGPLHRVLGYSSVSSVLRSRRYGDDL